MKRMNREKKFIVIVVVMYSLFDFLNLVSIASAEETNVITIAKGE